MLRTPLLVGILLSLQVAGQTTKVTRITSVNDSYPTLSPDGKTLMFQSDRSGDVEIWSMHIDGSQLKKLTSSPGYDGNPSWSPDGKSIAFASSRDRDLEVYTMDINGGNQRRLTDSQGNDGHPHWYPDGSRIIFNSARMSDVSAHKFIDEIFSMKPDGSDINQITDLKSVSTYASVSPDGRWIVFRGSTNTPAFAWDMRSGSNMLNSEIFVMDIGGNNAINISNCASFDGWPMWSPDSHKVVFASNRTGKPNSGQLYTCNVDGSELQKLTDYPGAVAQPSWSNDGKHIYAYQLWETPDEQYGYVVEIPVTIDDKTIIPGRPRAATSVSDSYPSASPDGKTLVFQSNRTGNTELYSIDTDGKNLKQLTSTTSPNYGPVWSPKGDLIVFASERDNDSEIYVMKPDGSAQRRVTNMKGDDSHPHWFPDGSRIIFNSSFETPDQTKDWSLQFHDVYSIKVDGTDVRRYTENKTVTTYPSMSPDGKLIAVRKVTDAQAINWDMSLNKRSRNSEVFVMNLTTQEQLNISNHFAFDGWPAWSPDSRYVVFASNRNGRAAGGQLYIAGVDGKSVTICTDLPGAVAQPSYSFDGKYIYAYQSFETSDSEFGNIIRVEISNQ